MLRRLEVYEFRYRVAAPSAHVPTCPRCFCSLQCRCALSARAYLPALFLHPPAYAGIAAVAEMPQGSLTGACVAWSAGSARNGIIFMVYKCCYRVAAPSAHVPACPRCFSILLRTQASPP